MKPIQKVLHKCLNGLEGMSLWISMFLFAVMFIIMFLAVILRYIFNIHLSWTDETTTHMMTWGVFLGVASVGRANSHIRIGFFAEKILGARRAAIVWTTTENVIGITVATYFAYYGYEWILLSQKFGAKSVGEFVYSLWILRSVYFIGMVLMAIFYFERIVKQIWARGAVPVEEQDAML